ncbi:MAG: methyltransferase, partial [Actinomycetota bacterium]
PYRDQPGSSMRTRFLPGRIRFLAPGQTEIAADERPPFGCMLIVIDAGLGDAAPPPATLFEGASL